MKHIKKYNESVEPKSFKEEFVDEKSFTELDMDYPYYEGDERNEVDTYDASFSETVSISIDDLMNCLQEMKDKGADRVYVAQHSDHHGYYITGVKLVSI